MTLFVDPNFGTGATTIYELEHYCMDIACLPHSSLHGTRPYLCLSRPRCVNFAPPIRAVHPGTLPALTLSVNAPEIHGPACSNGLDHLVTKVMLAVVWPTPERGRLDKLPPTRLRYVLGTDIHSPSTERTRPHLSECGLC